MTMRVLPTVPIGFSSRRWHLRGREDSCVLRCCKARKCIYCQEGRTWAVRAELGSFNAFKQLQKGGKFLFLFFICFFQS